MTYKIGAKTPLPNLMGRYEIIAASSEQAANARREPVEFASQPKDDNANGRLRKDRGGAPKMT
ncbi:MAG: hypothetical protein AB1656_01715 [Candidatus Omnitrophota bacterium]